MSRIVIMGNRVENAHPHVSELFARYVHSTLQDIRAYQSLPLTHSACIIAASHLLFFLYLSGRPSDGQDHSLSQTYSTTISIMLAGMFGVMLRLGISAAFTQYLWRLLRATPISAGTIERMFILRSSPASIFYQDVLVKAWPLVFMACLLWSTSIAISFPPGALTIDASTRTFVAEETRVPTFNASDVSQFRFLSHLQCLLTSSSTGRLGMVLGAI